MGLDECYSNIRGQILLMKPLPTAAKAYSMIRQEEKQREGILPKPTISTALSAQSYGPYNNNSRFTKQSTHIKPSRRSNFKKGVDCDNCSKEGHLGKECYRVVGYLVGHSLHSKFKPPNKPITQELKQYRTVNMAMGQVVQNEPDNSMSARMDQLQNQLNQVMMMMQNSQ